MISARPARRLIGGVSLAALAAGLLLAPAPNGADEAQARPQHLKFFAQKYAKEIDKDKISKVKCDICHEKTLPKDKKIRNPYGAALAKVVTENEKDQEAFTKAMESIEGEKSCNGETFGERIKKKELPADGCPPISGEETPLVPVPDANN